ncbi:MAG: hypothetical protein O3B76_08215 [Proteobacteria bacterium]|nr:hypothetical protein [Pseudomonadota bacterium]MDA1023471.1 hypothetical protein [Pseudomonadota bacterium]
MRFITEMDSRSGNWLVRDSNNDNAVVGKHNSATLAALDAFRREQDTTTASMRSLHLDSLNASRS